MNLNYWIRLVKNREVLIICRQRDVSADERKLSYNGILSWAGHINNKYFSKSISEKSSIKKIKSKIYNNISMPEWIGNHRFGLFDLLNYVLNEFRYVYNPSSQQNFFDPIGIPTITSIHIYEYLLKEGYNPVNIDNIKGKGKYIKALLKNNPLAVILSTTYFSSADELKQIICSIRRMDQNVPIIIASNSCLNLV